MLLSVPGKVLNRIRLVRKRTAVDILLRDQQAGFRKGRSCIDQIKYPTRDHGAIIGMEFVPICQLCGL